MENDEVTSKEISKVVVYQAKESKKEEFSRLLSSPSELPSGGEDAEETDSNLSSVPQSMDSELLREIETCDCQIAEIIPELEDICKEPELSTSQEANVQKTCDPSTSNVIPPSRRSDPRPLQIIVLEERISALEVENLELTAKNKELELFKESYEKEISEKLEVTQKTLSDLMGIIERFVADKLECEDFAVLENLPESLEERDKDRPGFRSSIPRRTTSNKMLNLFNLIAENIFKSNIQVALTIFEEFVCEPVNNLKKIANELLSIGSGLVAKSLICKEHEVTVENKECIRPIPKSDLSTDPSMIRLLKIQEDILISVKGIESRDQKRSVEMSQFLAKMECMATRAQSEPRALIPP